MKYIVYILESRSNGKLYIGQTNNITRRLKEHYNNQVTSTKNKGPWKLLFTKELDYRFEAIQIELKLKGWKSPSRVKSWIKREIQNK